MVKKLKKIQTHKTLIDMTYQKLVAANDPSAATLHNFMTNETRVLRIIFQNFRDGEFKGNGLRLTSTGLDFFRKAWPHWDCTVSSHLTTALLINLDRCITMPWALITKAEVKGPIMVVFDKDTAVTLRLADGDLETVFCEKTSDFVSKTLNS